MAVAALLLLPALSVAAAARDVQLPNPDVFGKLTSEPVKLLLDKNAPGDIEPYVVWSDVQCGRYIAASVYYRKPVTLDDVRTSVNRLYAASVSSRKKPVTADDVNRAFLWRVESQRFAISLFDEGNDGVALHYLHFAPMTEIAKGMLRGLGAQEAGRGSKKDADRFRNAAEAIETDCAEWEHEFAPAPATSPSPTSP